MTMDTLRETPPPPAPPEDRPTRISLGERAGWLLIGMVVGVVIGLLVRAALEPLVGHAMSKGIGRGLSVAIALSFMDGHPHLDWRWAITTLPVGVAAGLLAGWLLY